jgi:hypothetical protein
MPDNFFSKLASNHSLQWRQIQPLLPMAVEGSSAVANSVSDVARGLGSNRCLKPRHEAQPTTPDWSIQPPFETAVGT